MYTALAPAKINLYLHVTGRRADGYHELDSLIAFADIYDRVCVFPATELMLRIEGPFREALRDEKNNLVLRAARALADECGQRLGARIILTKNLPVSSGIGGGSSDAAATLKALNELWNVGADEETLMKLGIAIGSDVPVCLYGQTAHIQGIGDEIEPGPNLPDVGLLLANPGVAIPTSKVFAAKDENFSVGKTLPLKFHGIDDFIEFLSSRCNDLLPPAKTLSPEIDKVLSAINESPGCLFASLSGSGATCFGLFEGPAVAESVAVELSTRYKSWWTTTGNFINSTPVPI